MSMVTGIHSSPNPGQGQHAPGPDLGARDPTVAKARWITPAFWWLTLSGKADRQNNKYLTSWEAAGGGG